MAALDLDSGIDLEQLGLPIANTENKILETEVQKKQKEISTHDLKISDNKERVQAISDHLRNVKQELHHTQALLEARKKDVEAEEHLRQIAEREEGRLKTDMKRLNQEKDELKERRNMYENEIYRNKQKTEELKKTMNWDQQALEAWLEESARQDDDAMAIAKYARADEEKIRDLSLKMERLHDQLSKKKRQLDNEMIEAVTAQIELDKTAESFRRAHGEREELIDQWEQTINQMKRRDQDMLKCADDMARLRAEIAERQSVVREKQEFLDREKENNHETDKKLKHSERMAAKNRLDYQSAETARIHVRDEVETLKYSVDRMAAELESTRGQSAQLGREIKDKRRKLDTLAKQRELMQQELKKATQKTLTSEEQAHRIDEILAEEERNATHLEKELANLKERQFARAQDLFELKRKESSMEAELQGGKASLRNLGSKQHKLDEELLKQQEILYTQDFQLQQLRHKLSRMEGERTGEEMELLNAKIKALESDWERQQGEELLVQSQLKRVQEDLRRVSRDIAKGLKKKLSMEEKIDEMNLYIDMTQRDLKKVVELKQSKMVDENIIKLSVKRLRDHLYARADEVQSLEKRKLQLNTAMSERMREIAVHKDMLKAQIKASDGERQTVSSELHKHISKIDRLRKRYEIISVSMNPPEGEEQHSQAYYVIKAAQEREELQRHGDDLDSKIKKAEKEIRAMENTLQLMNTRNTTQRKSLLKVDKSSEEMAQLETLEGQWRATQDKFKHKRQNVRQVEQDMQVMERTLLSLKEDEAKLTAELDDKQNMLSTLTDDAAELKAKQERVALQTTRLVKELRSMQKVSGHTSEDVQRDIEVREMRDFSSNVVQQLGTLTAKNPQMLSTVQLMFQQAGLPPAPSPMGSRTSSRTSSARSSVASGGKGGGSQPGSARSSVLELDGGFGMGSQPPSARSSVAGGSQPPSARSSVAGGSQPPSARSSVVGGSQPPSARSSVVGGSQPPSARSSVAGGSQLPSSRSSVASGSVRSGGSVKLRGSATSLRSASSRLSATPTAPLQPTTVGIEGLDMTGGDSARSTPRAGESPSGSRTSLKQDKRSTSKVSLTSSRGPSRTGSGTSQGSKKDLDFTVRPS